MYVRFLSFFTISLYAAEIPQSHISSLQDLTKNQIKKLMRDSTFTSALANQANSFDNNLFISEFLRMSLIKKSAVQDFIINKIEKQNTHKGFFTACVPWGNNGFITCYKNRIEWNLNGTICKAIDVPGVEHITALAADADGNVYFSAKRGCVTAYDSQSNQYSELFVRHDPTIESIEIIKHLMLIKYPNMYQLFKKNNNGWLCESTINSSYIQLKHNSQAKRTPVTVDIFQKIHSCYFLGALSLQSKGKKIILNNSSGRTILCPRGIRIIYATPQGINECDIRRKLAGECALIYSDSQIKPGSYEVLAHHPFLSLAIITFKNNENKNILSLLNLKTGKNHPIFESPHTPSDVSFTRDTTALLLMCKSDDNNPLLKELYYINLPLYAQLQKTTLIELLNVVPQ